MLAHETQRRPDAKGAKSRVRVRKSASLRIRGFAPSRQLLAKTVCGNGLLQRLGFTAQIVARQLLPFVQPFQRALDGEMLPIVSTSCPF